MKKCPECDKENYPTADTCTFCGAKLPPAVPEESGGSKEAEPRPGRALAAAAGASRGVSGTGAEPARVSTPGPRPISHDSAPKKTLDPKRHNVINDYEGGCRIISVIGCGNSGKSFFVNRLRREMLYGACGAYQPEPEHADKILISSDELELTLFRPRKEDRDGDRVRQRPYLVVDCPGEVLREALEERRTVESFETQKAFICALGLATAYIFIIRVEDVLPYEGTPDEVRKSVQENLESFHRFVEAIVVSKHRLASGESAEAFVARGITRDETRMAFRDLSWHCDTPIVVAFSLSDRLMNQKAPEYFDYDPYLFAWERARPLFKVVRDSFEYYRFEFLTCFEGHDSSTYEVDYAQNHYGAVSTFDWIHRRLQPFPPGPFGTLRRWQAGLMPTRYAARARRFTDAEFRQAGAHQ